MRRLPFVALACLAACGKFTPAEVDDPNTDAGPTTMMKPPDASPDDGGSSEGTDGGLVDGTTPLPGNLESNGTFETTTMPWTGFQGTIALAAFGHTGGHSLRLCWKSGNDVSTADDKGAVQNPPFGTYRASAWVHTDQEAESPSSVALRARTQKGGKDLQNPYDSELIQPTATWTQIFATVEVTKEADELDVYLEMNASSNACVVMDDVVLTKD